jgi:S-DNA-T family DNA segregation ATPase FtsK/SpoIIIE
VSQIVALSNDLALAMEARGIRMVAPIPGKAAIGIEIPNRQPQTVYLKPIIRSETYVNSDHILPLALGKTINGEVYCADLTKMPHLLIAGSTGSGKSVGINTIIASIFYRVDPGKVKFVLIDPKKIELSLYRALSEHYLIWRSDLDEEVITKPSNAVSILNTLTVEMEKRYDKLAHLGVRNIEDYNMRVRQGGPRIKEEKLQQLPYIIIIIDELADLMMIAAKEVENPIARLTQMARAVGIHLILATQRPSVDVLTGVIKANFPARIAYMVTTRPDSKTILDMNGAEQLLGNGDMLYQPPGEPRPIRLQNPLITTREVERLISHIKKQPKLPHYSLPQPAESRQSIFDVTNGGGSDELYENAKQIVVQHQQGSISLLQRRLKIGYSRAARLIDDMEEEGVVGPAEGSKPRQVFYLPEDL